MRQMIVLLLVAATSVATTAHARAAEGAAIDALHAQRTRATNSIRARLVQAGQGAHLDAAPTKQMGSNPDPAAPSQNRARAYPPSCLASPLPDQSSGPIVSTHVNLYNPDAPDRVEDVTVTLWRMACSSSGSLQPYNTDRLQNAVTLLRIDRGGANDGNTSTYPDFPDIRVAQGNIGFDDGSQRDFVRLATDANTLVADTSVGSPLPYSTTYLLENYPFRGAALFNFNLAFDLRIDPGLDASESRTIRMPAYSPGTRSYPAAFNPLPITGYMTSNWFDPAHSGEGMVIQVFELPAAAGRAPERQVGFDWFTFNAAGEPFWIAGNAAVRTDAPAFITIPGFYYDNGGFAGGFGTRADANSWGEVRLQFDDCNHLTVFYAGNQGLPVGIPGGAGTLHYQRIANVNGLGCE